MENYKIESSIFSAHTVENLGSRSISKNFIANVFLWMFAGLGVSAIFAVLFTASPYLQGFLYNPLTHTPNTLGLIVMFAPILFVLILSYRYQKLSAPVVALLFMLYAAINGVSFSFILMRYSLGSVTACFASSSVMFGVMAVMGYTTNKDLTSFGRILKMALIGVVVSLLINIFLHSGIMDYIISIIGVMVFTGLTAYDVQKLKRIGAGMEFQGVNATDTKKLSVMGALNLYLDFLNIFLFMLRLFGNDRD